VSCEAAGPGTRPVYEDRLDEYNRHFEVPRLEPRPGRDIGSAGDRHLPPSLERMTIRKLLDRQ
jgi:hypothetical protein